MRSTIKETALNLFEIGIVLVNIALNEVNPGIDSLSTTPLLFVSKYQYNYRYYLQYILI